MKHFLYDQFVDHTVRALGTRANEEGDLVAVMSLYEFAKFMQQLSAWGVQGDPKETFNDIDATRNLEWQGTGAYTRLTCLPKVPACRSAC